ncbi:hypothetical protein ACN27F_27365 [Solwaraspora sp. WMMB335]|uniref:hypothetical protein n=1 Tax=Solwaraspora sp. WMMB335 TaxID=3404118 RepID=UPI003B929318
MVDDIFGQRRAAEPEPVDVTPPARPQSKREPRNRPDGDEPDGRDGQRGPRRSNGRRTRRVVAGSLVAAVGLVGTGLIGSTTVEVLRQKDATLTAPAEAAGLVRDDSEDARTTAEYLSTAFAAGIDLDRSIGVVYSGRGDERRSVLLFGGTTLLWSPERDLDTLLEMLGDEQGTVTGIREVPAGPYGGVMKCGATPTDDGDMPVCGWADHGSVAVAVFPGRSVDESAKLLTELRAAMQRR